LGGRVALGSGLFLGSEGPSIQLGPALGQGFGSKTSQTKRRVLIAAGAASGLSAAFCGTRGGTMFVLFEVFHKFSPS
ncbi:chloride channel protein, partial [Lactobacillus jensenii]|uniref:chloride channel protein n=1 Tax=Lactobacillus jensenii TaxID=109790 RepID=UPI00287001C8